MTQMDDVCNTLDVLRVIYFVKILIDIIMIVVPIGLIIMGLIDLSKSVVVNDDSARKKNLNMFIKRVVSSVILFAIPWVVKTFVHFMSVSGFEIGYLACYENANSAKIKELDAIRKEEEAQAKAEREREQAEKEKEKENNSSGSSSSSSSSGSSSNSSTKDYTIFVGDSRTVGMCQTVRVGTSEDCSIAKDGANYNEWLSTNETLGRIKSKLTEHPNSNVVINMGVNDYGNIDKYITLYNKLSSDYPKARFVIVSVTHVDDSKTRFVKNKDIENFNSKMKNGLNSNITYCDIYSYIKNNYSKYTDGEGVHYDKETYTAIYKEIKKCL